MNNIRIVAIVSWLSFMPAYSMLRKCVEWFEDSTPHMAIVNMHKPDHIFYDLSWFDAAERSFPDKEIERDTPLIELVCFNAGLKHKIVRYKVANRYEILKEYIDPMDSYFQLPITVMENWQEGDSIVLDFFWGKGPMPVICDQTAIMPKITFQKQLAVYKTALKKAQRIKIGEL
jgi:hypothetical protein